MYWTPCHYLIGDHFLVDSTFLATDLQLGEASLFASKMANGKRVLVDQRSFTGSGLKSWR